MTEDKKEVTAIALPDGDFANKGDQKFYRGFVRAVRGADTKYEYRMAVPQGTTLEDLEADCKVLYGENATVDFMIRTAVLNLATKADNSAKGELGLGPDYVHAHHYSPEKHIAMQVAFEAWRPGVRERKAVTPEEQADKLLDQEGGMDAILQALRERGYDIPTDEELGRE